MCTFLLDITSADVNGPLAEFQQTQFSREKVQRLVHTIRQVAEKPGEATLAEKEWGEIFNDS